MSNTHRFVGVFFIKTTITAYHHNGVIMVVLYIQPSAEGFHIITTKQTITFKGSYIHLMNQLLKGELTTYGGRMKAIEQSTCFKRNIPVYIDETLCFIRTHRKQDPQSLLINIHGILKIKAHCFGQTTIIFNDLTHIHLHLNYESLKRKIKRAEHLSEELFKLQV